ncbi:MAG TPA: Nif3-like dinuclear metal center hexameric protein [Peptococcaceae bacterium]|jgi:dinuclear metal center YbgI/SA1388 family protein|nr:Nif3-like dinuclear metal center hexameric protein [Clostridia bacterium]HQD54815.1 Nif3-like dinuclear metal center hexameric protein [Peptococcaceae bacterium]
MAVSCQSIINLIERFAPKKQAEEWDQVGLQIGSPAQKVNCVFFSLDLNEAILDEAIQVGADMLVVHHTPFFKPLQHLRTDLPQGRLLHKIVQHGLALYAAHTNLDAAVGGVNDVLAQKLGLQQVGLLAESWQEKLYKLVVFVPVDYTEQVCAAISEAGAGWIGNYSHCTFRTKGTGTFLPLAEANPFLDEKGELARVEEIRVETIVPEGKLSKVLQAMLKFHPYEEGAYDLYPLANEGAKTGLGRIGFLPEALTLQEFNRLVKDKLNIPMVRYCGDLAQKVEKVAVCGGSGASLLNRAAFLGAHVYLTADIKYHEAQEAQALGLALVDGGHFGTENPIVAVLADYVKVELAKDQVRVVSSNLSSDPFRFL